MDAFLALTADGADLELEGGDLRVDRGLRTAMVLSVFTDARIAEDERLPGHLGPEDLQIPGLSPRLPRNLRGYWADRDGDRHGSKFHLLARAKLTPLTVDLAKRYVQDALVWLVGDEIAEATDVTAERVGDLLTITARPARGKARRWDELWAGTGGRAEVQQDGLRFVILAG